MRRRSIRPGRLGRTPERRSGSRVATRASVRRGALAAVALAAGLVGPLAGSTPPPDTGLVDCAYVPAAADDGHPELTFFADCAAPADDGGLVVRADHLARLSYGDNGLAAVLAASWFWVDRDGRSAPVVTSDNGPDRFVDGRARTRRGGKIGFIDQSLRLAIPARFDGAFPFAGGKALVCVLCRDSAPDEEGRHRLIGGIWGVIDVDGEEVAPLAHHCEELDAIGGDPRWCREIELSGNQRQRLAELVGSLELGADLADVRSRIPVDFRESELRSKEPPWRESCTHLTIFVVRGDARLVNELHDRWVVLHFDLEDRLFEIESHGVEEIESRSLGTGAPTRPEPRSRSGRTGGRNEAPRAVLY